MFEYLTSEGDFVDYVRASENLAAMRMIAARSPHKARNMRSAINAELRKLETINNRYGV